MRVVPVGASDVVQPEPEQERLQPQLGGLERDRGGIAGAAQIADGFVLDAWGRRRASDPRSAAAARARRRRGGRSSPCRRASSESATGRRPGSRGPCRSGSGAGRSRTGRPRRRTPASDALRRSRRTSLSMSAWRVPIGPTKSGGSARCPCGVGDRDRVLVDVQTDEKRSRLCHG